MAVKRRLRFEVLKRDGHTCRYCGRSAPDVKLQVDHVIPEALGGRDEPANLVTACADCNAGKASVPPEAQTVEDVSERATQWHHAMMWAAEKLKEDRRYVDACCKVFDEDWSKWHVIETGQPIPRPDDWESSVKTWLGARMTIDSICDAIPTAMTSKANLDDKWRYFCGIVWRTLEKQTELALQRLDEEE